MKSVKTAMRDERRRARLRHHMAQARCEAIASGHDVAVAAVAGRSRRRARHRMREVAQVVTKRDRLAGCGRRRIAPTVQLRVGSRGAGYAGVMTCGADTPWRPATKPADNATATATATALRERTLTFISGSFSGIL